MEQIDVLSKIVKTSRIHFKNVESADFEFLKKQMEEYEEKIANFKLDDSKIAELRAKRAKIKVNNTQSQVDRIEYNELAKKHNFEQMKKPLSELFP